MAKRRSHLWLFALSCCLAIGLSGNFSAPAFERLPAPAHADVPLNNAPLLADLTDIFRRSRSVPLGSRGGICAIAPGLLDYHTLSWSDRPLFIWRGAGTKVNLRVPDAETPFWSPSVASDAQQLAYTGDPLQPGKYYYWQVLGETADGSDRNTWNSFEIMSTEQHDQISAELKTLTDQHSQESAAAIALLKAEFFAEKRLWSDALQILNSVQNPPPEIQSEWRSLLAEFCPA